MKGILIGVFIFIAILSYSKRNKNKNAIGNHLTSGSSIMTNKEGDMADQDDLDG